MSRFTLFLLSIGIGCITLPLVKYLAYRFDFLDKPTRLKDHQTVTPYLGGGVFIIVYVCYLLFATTLNWFPTKKGEILLYMVPLMFSIIGLIDDKRGLSPWSRLIFCLAFFSILNLIYLFGEPVLRSIIISMLIAVVLSWLLNSTNTYDTTDGALIQNCLVGLLVYRDLAKQQDLNSGLVVALIGGMLVYFVVNTHKATIFMGDFGSYFLGSLGILLTVQLLATRDIALACQFALSYFAMPSIDLSQAALFRLKNGMNPMKGSPHHLSHHLRRINESRSFVQVVLLLGNLLINILLGLIYENLSRFLVDILFVAFFMILVIILKRKRNVYEK